MKTLRSLVSTCVGFAGKSTQHFHRFTNFEIMLALCFHLESCWKKDIEEGEGEGEGGGAVAFPEFCPEVERPIYYRHSNVHESTSDYSLDNECYWREGGGEKQCSDVVENGAVMYL